MARYRGLALFLSCAVSMSFWGCGSEPESRPPSLSERDSDTGLVFPDSGVSGSQQGSSTSGAGGNAPQGEAVSGAVYRFVDSDFVIAQSYTETARISVWSREGSAVENADYNGESFSLTATEQPGWIVVTPEFDTTHLRTMVPWDGTGGELEVPMFSRASMSELLAGLIRAATINDERAQLIVEVLSEEGQGIAGVKPTIVGGPDLAFFDGGTWSDKDNQTGESGRFISYNIAARALPGQDVHVLLAGAIDAEFDVRVAQGTVSWVSFQTP